MMFLTMAASESAFVLPLRSAIDGLANRTILFRLGENIFVTFGLFAAFGAFLGALWTSAIVLGAGVPFLDVAVLVSVVLVGHVVLARVFLLPWRLTGLLRRPGQTLRTVEFASWGGFIAVALGLVLYAVLSGRSLLMLIDAAVLGGTLGHVFGRVGCLTLGCCFGRPTSSPFSLRYENTLAKAVRVSGLRGVPIHPVPLYEAGLILGLFFLLNALALGGSREGIPAAFYLVAYGGGRFFLENLRYNSAADRMGMLLRNQWLSLVEAGAGLVLLAALSSSPGPASPTIADAGSQTLLLLPVLAVSAAVVFVAYSLHRGTIGRW